MEATNLFHQKLDISNQFFPSIIFHSNAIKLFTRCILANFEAKFSSESCVSVGTAWFSQHCKYINPHQSEEIDTLNEMRFRRVRARAHLLPNSIYTTAVTGFCSAYTEPR